MTGRLKQRERGRDELNDAERVYADASWRGQGDRCPSLKKTKVYGEFRRQDRTAQE